MKQARKRRTSPTSVGCCRAASTSWGPRWRGAADSRLVEELPRILADQARQPARGLGRHQTVEPSNTGSTRRLEEQIASVDVTGVGDREEASLRRLLAEL